MRVLIAGDYCPKERVAELVEKGEYASVFGGIKSAIKAADFSIVNLECPITKGDEKPICKLGPNLSCSEKGIQALKWAGFNCVTLANNHFYDFGEEGVISTLETCRNNEIDFVGGGKNLQEASRVLYKDVSGQRLAIINCCEHEFSIATDSRGGSNPLDIVRQFHSIQEAKAKADFVLVIVHGGHEHWPLPSPRMVDTYRFFIEAGADAVVNHHQHCFSGFEIYQNKPIFYGLGNFCFDRPNYKGGFWNEGFLVVLLFSDRGVEYQLLPYLQCDKEPKVLPVTQDAYDSRIVNLNAIISDKERLLSETESYYASCANQLSSMFEPIMNRFYLYFRHRGWLPSLISKRRKIIASDYVICESHRDKLVYWLEKP